MSSFGYSGTIAHGAFEACRSERNPFTLSNKSLYRGRHIVAPRSTAPTRLSWLAEKPNNFGPAANDTVVFSGVLTPSAELLFSDHVVGGNILFPGVGYVEVAFAANLDYCALNTVAFVRPCILPHSRLGTSKRCELRCTRRETGGIEIASRVTGSSTERSFDSCFVGTLASCGDVSGVRAAANPFMRREYVASTNEDIDEAPATCPLSRPVRSLLPSWFQCSKLSEITNLIGSKHVLSIVKGSKWCRGGRAIVEKLLMRLGLIKSGSHATLQNSKSQAHLDKRRAARLWNPLQSHSLPQWSTNPANPPPAYRNRLTWRACTCFQDIALTRPGRSRPLEPRSINSDFQRK